jgi:hypothetical protein
VEIYFDAKDVDGSAKGEKYPVVTDGTARGSNASWIGWSWSHHPVICTALVWVSSIF